MAISRGPKLVTNGLVLALDPSDDNSFAAQNLPIKNGLILWLDAADDDSFVYSSGTEVSQWRDKSGNSFHANQSTTAVQPTRNTNNNSRKSVNFVAANGDYMIISSGISLPNDASIFIVYKSSVQSYQYAVLIDNYHGQGGNYGFVIQRVSTNSQFYYANAGDGAGFIDTSASPWTYTDNVIQLLSLNKASSTGTPYISGTAQTSRSVRAATAQSTTGLAIGYWGNGGGRFYNGDMCEILIFNRSLSSTEMKQVHTYLGQKWGIVNTDKSVVDASGGTYVGLLGNGTTSAMPVYDFYNKGALKFDGTDDYIVGTVPSIAASSTVGMWIKSASYNNKIPFSIAGATYGSGPNIFFYNNLISWNTGDGSSNSFSGSSYPDSNWHYIVVTNDAATNAKLYIDGTLIGTAIYKNTLSTNSNNLWLGRFSGDNNYTINANIAGTQIYNRVLSAAEILQNYNAQKSRFANTIVQSGLILNLDAGNNYSYAGSGTTWYDVSGTGNDFTIQGNVTWDATNGFSNFDGNSTGSGNKIYRNSFPQNLKTSQGGNGYTIIAVARSTVAGGWRKLIGNWDGDNYIDLYQNNSGSTWHQDGSGETLYVDGVQVSNDAYLMYNTGFHFYAATNTNNGTLTNPTMPLTIGNEPNGAANPNNYPWIGNIAIVLMYNRVLTTTELLQNYNALKGRFGL